MLRGREEYGNGGKDGMTGGEGVFMEGSKGQRGLLVFFITTLLISFAQRDTDLNHCDGDGETRVEIMAGGFEYMD